MLTVPQRRSLIEDLRLDGYTRRMIVEVLLLDALVLGVLASALGLLLGEVLSVALFSSSPGYLSFAFPIGSERIVTLSSVLLALGGGMVAAVAGVLAPLRAALAERPSLSARASRPVHGGPWWLLVPAAACLAGTTAILFAATQAAIVGVVSLTAALLLCLPALLDLAVKASCARAARAQRSGLLSGADRAALALESRPLACDRRDRCDRRVRQRLDPRRQEQPAAWPGCLGARNRLRCGHLGDAAGVGQLALRRRRSATSMSARSGVSRACAQ